MLTFDQQFVELVLVETGGSAPIQGESKNRKHCQHGCDVRTD